MTLKDNLKLISTLAAIGTFGVSLIWIASQEAESLTGKRANKLVREGRVEYRDVNNDGLADITIDYKDIDGKDNKITYFQTKDGRYLTAERIEAETAKSVRNAYSDKTPEKR